MKIEPWEKMCGDKRANNNQANRLELSVSEISARKNVVLNLFFRLQFDPKWHLQSKRITFTSNNTLSLLGYDELNGNETVDTALHNWTMLCPPFPSEKTRTVRSNILVGQPLYRSLDAIA